MLRVTFLGTASSRPTVRRNVSSLFVQREGTSWLFDCGEGTQRQMMRFGVGFRVSGIFLTHLHADHYLGVPGLLRTMALQGRREALLLRGPPGSSELLEALTTLGGDRLPFPVPLREVPPGQAELYPDFRIEAFPTRHTRSSVGWSLVESPRPGRFDPVRAGELGVPEGPLFGRLHRGETVTLPDGTLVRPGQVVGAPRPGRKLVYTGDTRPAPATVRAAQDADLLIHEATFGREERARAAETGHATAEEAAEVAREAGARRLALTHFSARYSEQAHRLGREAEERFPGPVVAEDGMTLEVPYPEEGEEREGGERGEEKGAPGPSSRDRAGTAGPTRE